MLRQPASSAEPLRRVGLDDPRELGAKPLVGLDLAAVGHDAVVHGQGPVDAEQAAEVVGKTNRRLDDNLILAHARNESQ